MVSFQISVCGSGSVVERCLAKANVAGPNPVSRSIVYRDKDVRHHSQVVRQRSATPSSPVRIWMVPPISSAVVAE